MTYGSDATGSYFGYDNMGRITKHFQVTGSTTYAMSYAYNFVGLLTNETYPSNRTLNYSYDDGARLSQVTDGATNFISGISYSDKNSFDQNNIVAETWGNGAVSSTALNRRLQPVEVKLKNSSGSELQRFNYSYGEVTPSSGIVDTSKNNGQIGRIDGYINGGSTKEWDQRFQYDEVGRLKTAAEYQQGTGSTPTWQMKYTYDIWGNRYQSGSTDNVGAYFTPVVSSDSQRACCSPRGAYSSN
jgi:YD repeat-containing protein